MPTIGYQYQPVPISTNQCQPVSTSADKYRLVPTNVEASKCKLKCLKVTKSFLNDGKKIKTNWKKVKSNSKIGILRSAINERGPKKIC